MSIDFSKIHSESLTQNFLLSKIDDATIFYHYFGPFDFKKQYRSVFSKDRVPSTGFYITEKGIIKYNDLRTRENWNCISFVAEKFGISYSQAIKKIAEDFGLIKSERPIVVNKEAFIEGAKIDKSAKEKTIIQIRPEKWTERTLKFWRVYDITEEELIRNNVFPIRDLYINKKKIYNKNNQIRFAYLVRHEGQEYMKIYSPYDKAMKWISNIPLNIPFGLESLPKQSKTLIITKSQKDRITLLKIFDAVMATQNESEASLTSDIIQILSTEYEFENKIIFWDNDLTGVESCKLFNEKGFGYFNIPIEYYKKYKIKDASDFVSYFGVEALKDLFIEKNIL